MASTVGAQQIAQTAAERAEILHLIRKEKLDLILPGAMRDNGIDMDDPTVDANGNLTFGGQSQDENIGEFDQDALQAAFDACEEYLAGVAMGFTDTDLSEFEDTLLEFTTCMRDQGFDMADPDLSGGPGGVIDMFGDLDPSDPDVLEAAEECQEVFANLPFGGGTG